MPSLCNRWDPSPCQNDAPRHTSLVFPMVALVLGTFVIAGMLWGASELFGSIRLLFRF